MQVPAKSFKAFSLRSDGLLSSLKTDIQVSVPILDQEPVINTDPRLVKTVALWDTGATVSCISSDLARSMGLVLTGRTFTSHAKGKSETNIYMIDIYLPNKIRIPLIDVIEVESVDGNFGIIIGMNIITLGDFAITNVAKATTFSFRIPSVSTIDYVHIGEEMKQKVVRSIGRNDPCICGSGKKYKNCCESKYRKS